MKSSMVLFLFFCVSRFAIAQVQIELEQYTYMSKNTSPTIVPIVHIQNEKWYGEVRYNYEELNTYSVYVGKIFSGEEDKQSYVIIPVIGAVMGEFTGGSVGLDVTFIENKVFFTSQSQYTFSRDDGYQNFLYSWSELGYQTSQWMYAGLALQHLQLFQKENEPMSYVLGMMIGLELGQFTIPMYSFSPFNNDRYFILGLSFGFGKNNSKQTR